MKICTKCKEEKPLDAFHNKAGGKKQSLCKDCARVAANEWRKANRSKAAVSMGTYRQTLQGCVRERYHNANHRAKEKGYDFDLSVEFLLELFEQQHGRCALTGDQLSYVSGDPKKASLDRIDSRSGYLKENVQWVTWSVNNLKGNLDEQELVRLCRMICIRKGSETIREEYAASAVEAPNP